MHYYQFNIGDYAKSTRHLTNTEDLIYRRLIDLYYDKEKPLIKDIVKLSRLINMRDNQDEIKTVLEDFFTETEEGFKQFRIDSDIASYMAKAESARINGKKGGRPRKTEDKAKKTQSVNSANPDETEVKAKKSESKANQEPRTINQEPLTINQIKDQSAKAKANEPYEIFTYWKEIMNKNNSSQFTAKRMKVVKDRLKDGYTVEQIKQAIYGCSVTPHNIGQNEQGKRFDCLELICRNGENVERFCSNIQKLAPRQFSSVTERNIETLKNLELD